VIDMKTNLHVNNTFHELSMDPRLTLLDALRHVLGLPARRRVAIAGASGTPHPTGAHARLLFQDENSVHADYLLPAGTESKETGHDHDFVVADSRSRN
jgi:aerobic-type carbon monoxide dehydrogenase small subunit (CoxS/CutS family)